MPWPSKLGLSIMRGLVTWFIRPYLLVSDGCCLGTKGALDIVQVILHIVRLSFNIVKTLAPLAYVPAVFLPRGRIPFYLPARTRHVHLVGISCSTRQHLTLVQSPHR